MQETHLVETLQFKVNLLGLRISCHDSGLLCHTQHYSKSSLQHVAIALCKVLVIHCWVNVEMLLFFLSK